MIELLLLHFQSRQCKLPFAVCIYACEENEGLQREHPFAAGFPIGTRACTREIIRNAKLNTEEYERLTAILEESTRATKEAHAEFAKHVAQCEERQRSMLNQFIESFEYNIDTGENYDESLIAIVNFANRAGFALQNVNFDDFAQAMTSHKTFRLK